MRLVSEFLAKLFSSSAEPESKSAFSEAQLRYACQDFLQDAFCRRPNYQHCATVFRKYFSPDNPPGYNQALVDKIAEKLRGRETVGAHIWLDAGAHIWLDAIDEVKSEVHAVSDLKGLFRQHWQQEQDRQTEINRKLYYPDISWRGGPL